MFELAYISHTHARDAVNSVPMAATTASTSSPTNYDGWSLVWGANKLSSPVIVISATKQYVFQSAKSPILGNAEQSDLNLPGIPIVVSPRDMVDKIRKVLGLNNVQVAEILRISRPSLYNHIAEKEVPKSLDGYQRLYEVAVHVEKNIGTDLKPGLKALLIEGNTLLGHLKVSLNDAEKINRICSQVAEKLARSPARKSIAAEEQRQLSRNMTHFS